MLWQTWHLSKVRVLQRQHLDKLHKQLRQPGTIRITLTNSVSPLCKFLSVSWNLSSSVDLVDFIWGAIHAHDNRMQLLMESVQSLSNILGSARPRCLSRSDIQHGYWQVWHHVNICSRLTARPARPHLPLVHRRHWYKQCWNAIHLMTNLACKNSKSTSVNPALSLNHVLSLQGQTLCVRLAVSFQFQALSHRFAGASANPHGKLPRDI